MSVLLSHEIPLVGGSLRGTTLKGGFLGGMTFSDTSGPLKILVLWFRIDP